MTAASFALDESPLALLDRYFRILFDGRFAAQAAAVRDGNVSSPVVFFP